MGEPREPSADAGAVDPGAEVRRRIGVAWRELRRGASAGVLRAHLYGEEPDALDLGQVDTLDHLAQCGPLRMRDLATALRVDASTATRAVDRLVGDGLAERRRADGDARAVEVALTPHGRARHDALVVRRRVAMERILRGLSETEREVLADLLERLIAGVDALTDDW